MNGVLLCAQDQGMHFALPLGRSADADRTGDVAVVAIRLGAEIKGHEVSFAEPSVRHRRVRQGAVSPGSNDDVECCPAGPLLAYEYFEPEPKLPLGRAGFYLGQQLTECLFSPADGLPDQGKLKTILLLPEFGEQYRRMVARLQEAM